jgi:hypothetical protein
MHLKYSSRRSRNISNYSGSFFSNSEVTVIKLKVLRMIRKMANNNSSRSDDNGHSSRQQIRKTTGSPILLKTR